MLPLALRLSSLLANYRSPMMVRPYSASYDSEQAASHHAAFSPATQLVN